MKKVKRFKFFVFVLLNLIFMSNEYCISQSFQCGLQAIQNLPTYSGEFRGLFKPIRTDLSGDEQSPSEAYFPVLIVFVQFKNDADFDWWHTNQDPQYLDSMISPIKRENSEWWNAYDENKEMVSDYWMEISQGKLHVCGYAYSIILDSTASYYQKLGSIVGERVINEEIWKKLNSPSIGIDWQLYDFWKDSIVNNEKKFFYQSDKKVDFIYKIHKTTGNVLYEADGYACLAAYNSGSSYEVDTINHIFINYGFNEKGSGATVCRHAEKKRIFYAMGHEHGHFLYANGHITYGKVAYGPGTEINFSPYEQMLFGFAKYGTADLSNQNTYTVGDYSGRDTTYNQFLVVPINSNESFVIANRGNLSRWDRVMLGDTVRILHTDLLTDYGKGAYIYHFKNQPVLPLGDKHVQDLECADGFWHWNYTGRGHLYFYGSGYCWDGGNVWYLYKKDSVLYDNDDGWNHDSLNPIGDEKSFWTTLHFSLGQTNQNPCQLGLDRVFTNTEEYFTNEPGGGDRWDPWNKDYNEVFSPYSSPSTKTMSNSNSNIYIYLSDNDNENFTKTFKIYRAGYNGMTDSSILRITPPSRPMGIKVEDYYSESRWCHPIVLWNHNREPDMLRGDTAKMYKIYRATQPDMNSVPGDYQLIATVYINKDSVPGYIDWDILRYDCAYLDQVPPYGTKFPVRYKIKAFDKYSDSSVFSDFASTEGISEDGGRQDGGDNPIHNKNVPDKFNLSQNYPNPFNPVTNIKYDLPKDIFVTIKIYDILGREIKTLVNEFKNAGSYLVSFNGSELASGVYFYRMCTKNYVAVKKLLIIK